MRKSARGHDLSALRRLNTSVVLRALRKRSPQTIGQLTGGTGLSRPTVEALVDALAAQGWITEAAAEPGERGPGRPARRYRFRAEAGRVLGIDIGRHKMVVLLSDLSGRVLAAEHLEIDPELSAAPRLDLLTSQAQAFLDKQGVRPAGLSAVCVGVPAVVDGTGTILSTVIPEWTGLDLSRRLAAELPGLTAPVLTENDVNLAVLAEHWLGAAVLADDVACVLAGRRVSCGVMLDGRLHRGRRGSAGELGTLPALGLFRAQEALTWDGPRPDGESELTALARAAAADDPAALRVLDRYAEALAPGIAALLLVLDPELLVLTGGATRVGDPLVPALTRHLAPMTLHLPRIALSTLGTRNVALGALRQALDRVDADLMDGTGPIPDPR